MEYTIEIPFNYSISRSYDDIAYYIITEFEKKNLTLSMMLKNSLCNIVVIKTNMVGIIEIMRESVLNEIQYIADRLIDVYTFTNPIVHATTTDLPSDSIITEEKFEKYLDYLEKETREQRVQSYIDDLKGY